MFESSSKSTQSKDTKNDEEDGIELNLKETLREVQKFGKC